MKIKEVEAGIRVKVIKDGSELLVLPQGSEPTISRVLRLPEYLNCNISSDTEVTSIDDIIEIDTIGEMVRFQTDRGLNNMKYNVLNEQTSIMQELFEASGLDIPKSDRPAFKKEVEAFMKGSEFAIKGDNSKHSAVDAYADVMELAAGAILKKGYDVNLVLIEMGKVINSRTGKMVDGKFEKDMSKESEWYVADYDSCLLTK